MLAKVCSWARAHVSPLVTKASLALLAVLAASSSFAEGESSSYTFTEAGNEMTALASGLKTFITDTALPQIIVVVAAVLGIVMVFRAIRWCLRALNV